MKIAVLQQVMDHAEVCVVGCKEQAVLDQMDAAGDRVIVDLVRLSEVDRWRTSERCVGIAW
jgi:GDP-mannose 6-dehydrogenase